MPTKKAPAPKFKNGEHVKLLPFEDQPLEYGTIDEYEGNGLYCVTLDKKYRGKGDDGIREVDEDQLEKVTVTSLKALSKALDRFIYLNVVQKVTAFSISEPHRDGTVIVRFRSDRYFSADETCRRCGVQLTSAGKDFVQTDDNKLRIDLMQFQSDLK